ncbi:MAG: heavy-metal-associated domain-containing protein [Sediminispirochaetaceae bacterium]
MKLQFNVPDMSCQHCKHRIEEVVGGCEEVESVNVDLDSKIVRVDSALAPPALIALFDQAGYDASLIEN